ncbi:MAG TPA: phosphoenolpyruvate carboxykinase (ATP) [Thermoanaerobaculia bacterium]|nr:phosphoenolpyruvate carboxykinase (ATP) [Thermoanaerobaculia bacterium]
MASIVNVTGPLSDLADSAREGAVLRNLAPALLYEEAVRRDEALITAAGPLLAVTGEHTGRSPNDRFLVRRPGSESEREIQWGPVNRPLEPEKLERLAEKIVSRAQGIDLFVFEGYAGADPATRIKVRVVTERAWHSLFARNMFIRETDASRLEGFEPDFTVIDLPSVQADPATDGTRSSTFVVLDLDAHVALIGGTEYAGEIKKSVFSVMNYRLPRRGVLSMHCSANYGADRDDVALFFGLSGTGKTTLSADPGRILIGDDEHGWGDRGIFNVEGGCYAKVIRLDPEGEPAIYATTRTFGTVLENVVCDPETRVLDLDDDSLTENTRSSYPLGQLDNVDLGGIAGHPRAVVFLTCDAFGVLPPISRLDDAQAAYHFLSGYTAKVAGTERGVTQPKATFSACFGAPFMPLDPARYAMMLSEKLRRHDVSVWLVNTGWTGGPFGVGRRMPLQATRRIVNAVLSGDLDGSQMRVDPVFGLRTPLSIEGVDSAVLDPRGTWSDTAAYDAKLRELAAMFAVNFRQFEATAPESVRNAGPRPDAS